MGFQKKYSCGTTSSLFLWCMSVWFQEIKTHFLGDYHEIVEKIQRFKMYYLKAVLVEDFQQCF